MRAKTVNFEKGGDPLDTLDIGRVWERKNKDILEKMKPLAIKHRREFEILGTENPKVCIKTQNDYNQDVHVCINIVNYGFTDKTYEARVIYNRGTSSSNIGISETLEEAAKKVELYLENPY